MTTLLLELVRISEESIKMEWKKVKEQLLTEMGAHSRGSFLMVKFMDMPFSVIPTLTNEKGFSAKMSWMVRSFTPKPTAGLL